MSMKGGGGPPMYIGGGSLPGDLQSQMQTFAQVPKNLGKQAIRWACYGGHSC